MIIITFFIVMAVIVVVGAPTMTAFGSAAWLVDDDEGTDRGGASPYAFAYTERLYAFAYMASLYGFAYSRYLYAFAYIDKVTEKWYVSHMDTIIRTAKQIGDAVKRIRRQKNLTQEALGQKFTRARRRSPNWKPASRQRNCASSWIPLARSISNW